MNQRVSKLSTSVLLRYVYYNFDSPMQILRGALVPTLDGVRLRIQSSRDGVCIIARGDDLNCTVCNSSSKYGFVVPDAVQSSLRLVDTLELPFKLVNIELVGECVWKQALAAVEAYGALSRTIFSSFEHSEILQLWSACHEAECGLSWEDDETLNLNHEMLSNLPDNLRICISIKAVLMRRDFWESYRSRLIIWGAANLDEADMIGFRPAIVTVDSHN